MNFVELGSVSPLTWIAILLSLPSMVAGIVVAKLNKNFLDKALPTLLVGVLILGGMFSGFIGLDSLNKNPRADQKQGVIAQVEDNYGFEIQESDFYGLKYPRSKPESDFEVFGSISRDQRTEDGFERTEIFLIWRDGEMALAGSPDGETFTELQR